MIENIEKKFIAVEKRIKDNALSKKEMSQIDREFLEDLRLEQQEQM